MIRYIFIISLFLLQSVELFSQNHYWKNLDGLYGGLLYSVAVYKNYIYYAGNGGVFGSSDNGENWECLGFRDQKISEITITADQIFAISNNGCFRCRLHDTTWTKVKTGKVQSVNAKDSILFIGDEYFGLYRSSDLGNTWTKVDKDFDNHVVQIFITSNDIVLASVYGGIFRSTDMGDSWNRIDPNPDAWNFEGITEYDQVLYAFDFENHAKVYKSTDFGQSWILPPNATAPSDIIQSIYSDETGIYVGVYHYGFFRSNDEGTHWTKFNSGLKNKNILSIDANSLQIFAVTFDGIYRYPKGNNSWIKKSKGINNSWITSLAEIDNNLLVGTYGSGLYVQENNVFNNINLGQDLMFILDILVADNKIYVLASSWVSTSDAKFLISANNGSSWGQNNNGFDTGLLESMTTNDEFIYAGTEIGLYRTHKNSGSWVKLTNGIPSNINVGYVASSDSVVIVTNGTSQIYRSTDYGDTWQSLYIQNLPSGKKIISSKSGEFYLGSYQVAKLFKSIDYGLTWQSLSNPLSGSDIQAIYTKDNEVFVGLSNHGILTSEDAGLSWEKDNIGLASKNITSFTNIGNDIIAGSYLNGLYKRTEGVIEPPSDSSFDVIIPLSDSIFYNNSQIKFIWTSSNIAYEYRFQLAEDSLFSKLIIDERNIFDTSYTLASLDYNKFYYWRVSGVTILWDNHFSRIQKIRLANPSNFFIYNNYPNPFNNTTIIKFDVPIKSIIELELFDILGRKIKTLL
ncbi:MAG: hypothetical protein KKA19_07435, partial [Candidatus Margulisbacteria bacterium]|nr:hypothetical protein [Candidatus Margulisiibacteriota bacterium]